MNFPLAALSEEQRGYQKFDPGRDHYDIGAQY